MNTGTILTGMRAYHERFISICLAAANYHSNPAGGSRRVTGTRLQEGERVMNNLSVNIEIENLTELKKLLSTASELSKQLETTLKRINEIELSVKSQVGVTCKHE